MYNPTTPFKIKNFNFFWLNLDTYNPVPYLHLIILTFSLLCFNDFEI
jgi:predicted ABC-type sugar transport system permease subunit